MVPPTVKLPGAVSAWKEEVSKLRGRNGEHANNQDDAFGNSSYYFKGFVPKIDDVQFYGNGQNFDYNLKPGSDITTLDRELNGFMQTKSIRGPVVALPSKDIEVGGKTDVTLKGDEDAHGKQKPLNSATSLDNASYKKTATISKVEKCINLSRVRANLKKLYKRVLVVDNVSTAKETVAKLMNEYRNLVHACDTEVSRIDVKMICGPWRDDMFQSLLLIISRFWKWKIMYLGRCAWRKWKGHLSLSHFSKTHREKKYGITTALITTLSEIYESSFLVFMVIRCTWHDCGIHLDGHLVVIRSKHLQVTHK